MSIAARFLVVWLAAAAPYPVIAAGGSLLPPQDPRESIHYWKPHRIAPQSDRGAAAAHRVFEQLLRAWDSQRLAPKLVVVRAEGAWAAALADGHILITRQAIEICFQMKSSVDDFLAFVLAHELSHQRSDDLWHFQFLRLAGHQSGPVQKRMLSGLNLDKKALTDIQRREAQADHGGLIMMAVSGFNPFAIVGGKDGDFFSRWVAHIWSQPCALHNDKVAKTTAACRAAANRALRARTQLAALADQSALFQLGMQSFAAARYESARRYFAAFGRAYPGRAVHFNLGLSHLAEAVAIRQDILQAGLAQQPRVLFPIALDARIKPLQTVGRPQKRGIDQMLLAEKRKRLEHHCSHAIAFFERAAGLQPEHRSAYLMKIVALILQEKYFSARAYIHDTYVKRFSEDKPVVVLQAVIHGLQRKYASALQLLQKAKRLPDTGPYDATYMRYVIAHNESAILNTWGRGAKARAVMRAYMNWARREGRGFYFQWSLAALTGNRLNQSAAVKPVIMGHQLGDVIKGRGETGQESRDLWFEGEHMRLLTPVAGTVWMVDEKYRLHAAWQSDKHASIGGLKVGDSLNRAIQVFGSPSRHIPLTGGNYVIYDHLGIGLHFTNGRVRGWFLLAYGK